MKKLVPPKTEKFPAAKQRRLDRLLEKNSEGNITRQEKASLKKLVAEAERLMVANAKRFERFSRDHRRRAPARAVPVTVWIQPETAE